MPGVVLQRFIFLFVGASLLAGCKAERPQIVLSGPTMGTTYSIKIVDAPSHVERQTIQSAVDRVLERIDREMSSYRDDSELSRFNASTSTDWFAVSQDIVQVVEAAKAVSEATQGALDITVAPLVSLWGFGTQGEPASLPSDEQIESARARSGYRRLHTRMQPPALRKEIAGLAVDLNSVAPGFATDMLFASLVDLGLANVMVDIGGEVRARGVNATAQPWRIAVEKPLDAEPEPYAVVQLNDSAITTSGEYRHYYSRNGQRYSHTIDPRTGHPVQHRLASVAVIAATALEADAWTTALNVLGEEQGYVIAAEHGIAALFIVALGAEWQARTTRGFRPYLAGPLDE